MLHWANWPMNLICSKHRQKEPHFEITALLELCDWLLQMPLSSWWKCVLVGVHPAVRFDFDLTHALQSPGASAGCVFTQTARRHHLMALISISFKSILCSLPSFHPCKDQLLFLVLFFFIETISPPLQRRTGPFLWRLGPDCRPRCGFNGH